MTDHHDGDTLAPHDDRPPWADHLLADLVADLTAVVRHEHSMTRADNRVTRETLVRHARAMSDYSAAEDHPRRWGHREMT